ncbi:LysR family hydrogen peroxide-inducible transcriptional activator [Pseudomonas sp. 3296]|uniref:LysR substrate-binding domain-containing protein n=1 Tax=Pseudomonas sp. 3296 TaxID=2817753 RepID=UPI00286545B6|nr:LysR substrate-binding domain-containing protein [Pseudomonas sp. 3296]MDR6918902.1 LysR family hydrogen peroxide-inducible transcriptional activator [Pseudomonas sp. 3296]
MTLRELRYLVALADHRHFGRAADACHVTQSTLSTQLRKLENYLGQVLVDRQSKQLMLTPTGEQIVERARHMLVEADTILALTRARRQPLEGMLTLGIIPTLAPYYLPHLLHAVEAAHPKLQLMIQEGLTGDLCERLNDQSIDTALLALPNVLAQTMSRSAECLRCEAVVQGVPHQLDRESHDQRVLFDEPFWVAMPLGHAATDQDSVKVDTLDDLKLLLLTDGHCLRGQALEACGRSDEQAGGSADCRATSLETLQHLVAAGRGCTLLPALAASKADTTRLSIKPLHGNEYRRIGLVWRRSHPRTQEFDLLANTLRSTAPAGTLPWRS